MGYNLLAQTNWITLYRLVKRVRLKTFPMKMGGGAPGAPLCQHINSQTLALTGLRDEQKQFLKTTPFQKCSHFGPQKEFTLFFFLILQHQHLLMIGQIYEPV